MPKHHTAGQEGGQESENVGSVGRLWGDTECVLSSETIKRITIRAQCVLSPETIKCITIRHMIIAGAGNVEIGEGSMIETYQCCISSHHASSSGCILLIGRKGESRRYTAPTPGRQQRQCAPCQPRQRHWHPAGHTRSLLGMMHFLHSF